MRTLVQSLKRLYAKGSVTQEKIHTMVEEGKLTEEEYEYIVGEPYDE
jgi:hypothetical protein